jgi:hypothetical protein
MLSKPKNIQKEPYLRTDLSAEENERLTKELEDNPALLRELLQYQSLEDKAFSDGLLFSNSNLSEQEALDGKIRKYLLCDPTFSEEEIAELEDFMVNDERYFERMSLIESELIEDYWRGALTEDEEKRFNSFFLVTPERQEKSESIKALMLDASAALPEADRQRQPILEPTSLSWWQSLLAIMRSPNLLAGATAASVLLFLVVGALWWFSQSAERQDPLIATAPTNESTQNPNQSTTSNQLANTGETGNVSFASTTPKPTTTVSPQPTKLPQSNQGRKQDESPKPTPVVKPPVNAKSFVVFALSVSGLTRGGGNAAEKKIEPGVKFVQLRLQLDTERKYDDFRLVVQDSDGKEVERRERLKATKKGDSLTTALSAALFKPDDYTVILSGGTKGVYEEAARYSFRVLK